MIDAEIPSGALTLAVVEEIEKLEPHGIANPRPLLLATDLEVAGQPREVGETETAPSVPAQAGRPESASHRLEHGRERARLTAGSRCSVVFHPSINEWNNRRDVQLEIKDFAPLESV